MSRKKYKKELKICETKIQAINNLKKYGFCLIKNAISKNDTIELKNKLKKIGCEEDSKNASYREGGYIKWGEFKNNNNYDNEPNQRIWMLVNKDEIFLKMLKNKKIRKIINDVLGSDYILSSHGANIIGPGNIPMDLHVDQWWMPLPIIPNTSYTPVSSITRKNLNCNPLLKSIQPPVVFNVLWMLDDFIEDNGSTTLIPYSHLCINNVDNYNPISVVAPKGTALIIDGRTLHGTGCNITNKNRYAILTTFCGPQFRPQENYPFGLKQKIINNLDEDLLNLLGFKIWNGYGRIGDPNKIFIN